MSRILTLISLLIVLAVFGAAFCMVRSSRLDSHFDTIEKGMSREDVLGIMGSPSWNGACGRQLGIKSLSACTEEFGYSKALSRWDPDYLIISFGADGKVMETAHITSP